MNVHVNCSFCSNQAKYTCPKCKCEYCSLSCYKSDAHKSCSEEFYHNNIEEEIRGREDDEAEKIKLAKLVRKYNTGQGDEGWKYEIPQPVEKEYRKYASKNCEDNELTEEEEKELKVLVEEADFDQLWKLLSEEERLDFIKRYGDIKG